MDPGGCVLKFGRFELDLTRRELRRGGTPVDLQRAPLRVLLYLAEQRDRTVPTQELLEELWPDSNVTDSSLSNAVYQIRRVLGDDGAGQQVIRSLRGRGYRFVAEAAAAPLPPIRAIAVLPLENLSGDSEQEYFADGMTEALIGELGKIGSLRVISRSSVVQYKGRRKRAAEIASELGVEGLIEGSVIQEGTRIRISLQLIDGRKDSHVWAKSYERDLRSVLALQGEVARAVAEQIRVELTPDERSRLKSSRTINPEAYDAYMRAIQLTGATDLTGFPSWGPKAIAHLERAVRLDRGFARAWALLGQVYFSMSLRDFSVRDAKEKARQAVQRALDLDEHLGLPHATLGFIRRFYDWDLAAAGSAVERAIELSPNDPIVLRLYANHVGIVEGRTHEEVALSERAMLLEPFAPRARIWFGNALLDDGQYDRAIQEYERARELVPGFRPFQEFFCLVELGRLEEAHQSWVAGGGVLDREARERAWSDGGWQGAARAWIDAAARRQDVNPAIIAIVCAWIGEVDEAFSWFERAYRVRDPEIHDIKLRFCNSLRSDPRYGDLLQRIGFPEE